MSDDRIVFEPAPYRTLHPLPPPANYRENTVARCPEHGELFVARVSNDNYSSMQWCRLRWWHVTARRALAGALGSTRPPWISVDEWESGDAA